MDAASVAEQLEQAVREDGRYALEAYEFLNRALRRTTELVHGELTDEEERPRHVTGQQLCQGVRDLLLETYGRLTPLVLRSWRVRCTRDIGEMVYFLINLNLMGRQESDDLADFDDVYDFREAFGAYAIPLDAFDEATYGSESLESAC